MATSIALEGVSFKQTHKAVGRLQCVCVCVKLLDWQIHSQAWSTTAGAL